MIKQIMQGILISLGLAAGALAADANITFEATASPELFSELEYISPDESVTVAEAVTAAAKTLAHHNGESIPNCDGEWYAKYVSYGISKGFVAEGQFDSYDRPVKRYEAAMLFEEAMPQECFAVKNEVDGIPDVSELREYHSHVMTLYKAGVLTGTDSYGNFLPENEITMSELTELVNRIAIPEKRRSFSLDKISDDNAYALCLTSGYNASKEGIASGWVYDCRGSVPKTELKDSYGMVIDISEDSGVALIREFNKTPTGKLFLQTSLHSADTDGYYIEFRNDKDMSVLRLEMVDGVYVIPYSQGHRAVYYPSENERQFAFEVELDLDNSRATININDTDCGTYALMTSGDDSNILNFRFATTEKETAMLVPGMTYIHGNYSVIEYFMFDSGTVLPTGWQGNGAIKSGALALPAQEGWAEKKLSPVSDTVIAETMLILPEGESVEFSLKSGSKTIARFESDSESFYVNDVKVYESYYKNLWYILRLEANTDTGMVLVKLNGKKLAELPFEQAATSADSICFANYGDTVASFDDIRVYRSVEREDYVPVPVVPQGEDKYVVGMNVCSLWRNENHFGWHCITPYDDPQPVLGYYDEGMSEVADWEIKYLVEHGIDFQAFCIYANSSNGVQRYGASHLYDGFMNAKYSDMSKFCVIWETANAQSPSSFEAWKQHYVPYFIEYYFKDPRHITIDNRLVLCVFGANKLPQRLNGSNADVKELFDYLEQEVIKLGFDGMIYLACGSSSASLAEMGFDGCYAYNWGTSGYQYATNINGILNSASEGSLYTVPTISVGFNSIPWHGVRYPMMSKEDYASAHEWVKTEYLKTYPTEAWQEKFVMLSTWNEYGEGTYLMPTTDEKGFMYLDVLRQSYTDEAEDASLNTVPTEQQRYRINRLYPQYRRLLRKEGYVLDTIDPSELEPVFKYDYSNISSSNVWSVTDKVIDSNGVSGVTQADSIVMLSDLNADLPTSEVVGLKIRTKFPVGTRMQVFFTTTKDTEWSEGKSKLVISDSNEMKDYYVLFTDNTYWKDEILGLRIDPVSEFGKPFILKSAEFLAAPNIQPKAMIINGQKFTVNFRSETAPNGDPLVAFDPAVGMDLRLCAFHEWDKQKGELKLSFENKVLVFTLGKDYYTSDGKVKQLGYEIYDVDGLPMLPINVICNELGYTLGTDDQGLISVDTHHREYYDMIKDREFAKWEFDFPGDTEKWQSFYMSLVPNNGYMSCKSINQSTDPTIVLEDEDFVMDAEAYSRLEYRVRYKYNSGTRHSLTMYFITNNDTSWHESKSLKAYLNSTDSGGEWETYSVDLTKYPLWKDDIIDLRFDPFNATGEIDVDYIRFIPAE